MKRLSQWVLMIYASAFAVSYFYWSDNGGNLFGTRVNVPIGIGFPFQMFGDGPKFPMPTIDWFMFTVDVLVGFAAVAAAMIFELFWTYRKIGSPTSDSSYISEPADTPNSNKIGKPLGSLPRISIRQLMISSVIVGLVLSMVSLGSQFYQDTLRIICITGPVLLAWCFYLLADLNEKVRSAISFVFAMLLMIGAGVAAELSPSHHDFTRGLLAVFVCWVPVIWLMALAGPFIDWIHAKCLPTKLKN